VTFPLALIFGGALTIASVAVAAVDMRAVGPKSPARSSAAPAVASVADPVSAVDSVRAFLWPRLERAQPPEPAPTAAKVPRASSAHGRFGDPARLFAAGRVSLTSPSEIASVMLPDGEAIYAAEDQILLYLAPALSTDGLAEVMDDIAGAGCRIIGVKSAERMVQVATPRGAALEPLIESLGEIEGVVRSGPNRMVSNARPFETSPWAR